MLVSHMVHRGHLEAAGYYLSVTLLGEQEARKRIVSLWCSGTTIYRVGTDLVLILPKHADVRAELSMALPLSEKPGQVYAGLELDPKALKKLNPPASSLVLARHGEIVVEVLQNKEDPADWFDLTGYTITEGKPLSKPKAPPVVVEQQDFDARSKLEGIPKPAAEMMNLLALWKKTQDKSARNAPGGASTFAEMMQKFTTFLKKLGRDRGDTGSGKGRADTTLAREATVPQSGFFAEMLAAFLSLFSRGRDAKRDLMVPTQKSAQQSWMELHLKMNSLSSMLLSSLGIMSFLQAQQARYLSKLMTLLNRGDWSEALKYAIPLGKTEDAGPAMAFLGFLFPRGALDISFGPRVAGSSIPVGNDFVDQMRNLYRRAFEHLAAAGKIDEAAFILAELLQNSEEAVQFLERHGRLQTAAELAEARKLRAPIVVRQWFIAGKIERAVSIARLTNTFGEAVTLLEKTNPHLAAALRTFWASSLAEAGNYSGAIAAIWPNVDSRHLAKAWLKLALAAGGATSGQLLARQLSLDANDTELQSLIRDLLGNREKEQAPARLAFVEGLISNDVANDVCVAMMRQATRSIMLDVSDGAIYVTKNRLKRLTEFGDDRVLWADISGASYPRSLPKLSESKDIIRFAFDESDSGNKAIYDGVLLPTGNAIVALGEAGIYILNKDGRVIRHLLDPAQRLVVSDQADRTIAVADRDDAKRLTVIDILKRTSQDMGEMILDQFAADYDGSLWVAQGEGELMVLDLSKPKIKALWRMPGLTGKVTAVARDKKNCSFITYGVVEKDLFGRNVFPQYMWERWACDALDLQLRNRYLMELPNENYGVMKLTSPQGTTIELYHLPASFDGKTVDESNLQVFLNGSVLSGRGILRNDYVVKMSRLPADFALSKINYAVTNRWLALTMPGNGGYNCLLVSMETKRHVMQIHLAGAKHARPTIRENTLTVTDDRGRLLAFELENGRLIRNLRIT